MPRKRLGSILKLPLVKVTVVLNTSNAKALHTRTIDSTLPARKFFKSEPITFKHFVDRKKTTVNGGDNFSLSAYNPSFSRG